MSKKNTIIILVSFIFLALPKIVFGAPSITGVSGNIANGESIVISGSGFGTSGPNVVLFDSFEKGSVGNNISIVSNSADVGNWNGLGNIIQIYSSDFSISGTKAMKVDWSNFYGSGPYLRYSNVQNSDILISWWQYMPTNKNVPGTNGPEAGQPNWKWFWIGDEGDDWPWGSDYVTVCLSNNNCDATIAVFPADDLENPQREGGDWIETSFMKGTWVRVSVAMKNAVSGGYIWNQEVSSSGNIIQLNQTGISTAHLTDPWNILSLPGFGRQDNTAAVYYDDVYVATGASARARIEIGNASTYNASTNLALLTPTSWGASSISATVRGGSFTGGNNAYLYVVDSTGAVNATGYPITIGSGSGGDTTAPTVTNFQIPSAASSLTVSITNFTASDNVGVTGYKLTESSTKPNAGDPGWNGTPQSTYTFSTEGTKTLYAWAKDAAGNVSNSLNDSVVITLPDTTAPNSPQGLNIL
ncbi:MAG: hypothetical protein V3574_03890 [Candidatus Moraniibacteriota bacterium]